MEVNNRVLKNLEEQVWRQFLWEIRTYPKHPDVLGSLKSPHIELGPLVAQSAGIQSIELSLCTSLFFQLTKYARYIGIFKMFTWGKGMNPQFGTMRKLEKDISSPSPYVYFPIIYCLQQTYSTFVIILCSYGGQQGGSILILVPWWHLSNQELNSWLHACKKNHRVTPLGLCGATNWTQHLLTRKANVFTADPQPWSSIFFFRFTSFEWISVTCHQDPSSMRQYFKIFLC